MTHDQLAPARMFTAEEVALVLRVSRPTVYRYAHTGRLPAVRLSRGGPLRIPADALARFLKGADVGAA